MKNKVFKEALKGSVLLFIIVVVIETIIYSGNFLLTGILKNDIFNNLEKKQTYFKFSLIALIVLSACVPLLVNFVKQIDSYYVSKVQQSLGNNLRESLYKNIINMRGAANLSSESGGLISYFRDDVNDIVNFLMEFYYRLPSLALAIGAIIIMLKINTYYTMISLLSISIVVLVTRIFQAKLIMYRTYSRAATGETLEALGGIFNSIEAIKLSSKSNGIYDKVYEISKKRAKYSIKDNCLNGFLEAFSGNIMNLTVGAILLLAIADFKNGSFTLGNLVLFEYYFWFLNSLPTMIGNFTRKYKQASIAINRIDSIGKNVSKYGKVVNTNDTCKLDGNIVVTLKQEIPYVRALFKGFSFEFSLNALVVISGKIGSGKTSFLRVFISSYSEEYVSVTCQGKAARLNPPSCCCAMQTPVLFSDTIKNNICMGKKFDEENMKQVLEKVAFTKDLLKLEKGIFSIVGTGGTKLSGGQRKRIAIARALYQNPKMLLLDDCMAGLDIVTSEEVYNKLIEKREYTFIIATNDKRICENADILINLDNGMVKYNGLKKS